MILKKWEQLPIEMQTEEVKKYYDILKKKKFSLFAPKEEEPVNDFLTGKADKKKRK